MPVNGQVADSFLPLVVALAAGAGTLVTALLARRSSIDDRVARRQEAEVRYLAERLDEERRRADGLEAELRRWRAGGTAGVGPTTGGRPARPPGRGRSGR